jgi:branched-chain amino acid transport system substrate-binding protein
MRIFLLTLFIIFLNCSRPKVYVGVLVPLTGTNATYGKQVLDGIELAYEEAKREGKIPVNLELIKIDNKSSSEETKKALEKLSEKRELLLVIGPVTSEMALVAASVASRIGIPLITPTATNPKVTKRGECVFRVCYTDPLQGKILARFAYGFLGLKKAAIFFEANNPYSEGLARNFEKTFKELGGTLSKSYYYVAGDTLLSQRIDTIMKAKPELLFIPGYVGDVVNILKTMKEKNFFPVVLGGDGWHSPELIDEVGYLFEDGFTAYISTHFSSAETSPETRKFVKIYREKYGTDPEAPSALGYDAFNLVISVLEKLKSYKREEFCSALINVEKFTGATGVMKFEGSRDPVRDIFISKVTPDGFKFIMKGREEE